MAKKYLDYDGLLYFWQKIKLLFVSDVTYNSTSKKLQKTKAGSTSDLVTFATVATSGSYNDLSNKPTIPSAVQKTTTTPKMDGTAAIGTETKFAAGDHVHPSDTSRVPTTRKVNGHALSADVTVTASDIGVESGAEVNQNAFGNIAISGGDTLSAEAETDTVNFIPYKNMHIEAVDTSASPNQVRFWPLYEHESATVDSVSQTFYLPKWVGEGGANANLITDNYLGALLSNLLSKKVDAVSGFSTECR